MSGLAEIKNSLTLPMVWSDSNFPGNFGRLPKINDGECLKTRSTLKTVKGLKGKWRKME